MNAATAFVLAARPCDKTDTEIAYHSLVALLADGEPAHYQWTAADLPTLTEAQIRLVLHAKSVDVGDETIHHLDFADLDDGLEAGAPSIPLCAHVLWSAIEKAARVVLFRDVQDEIARRAEFAQWEER
jgi:hypothetical protein